MRRRDIQGPEEITLSKADADRFLEGWPRNADDVLAGSCATESSPAKTPTLAFERAADGVEQFFRGLGCAAPQLLPATGVARSHKPLRRQFEDASPLHTQGPRVKGFRLAYAPQQLHLRILKGGQCSGRTELVDNALVVQVGHIPGPMTHLPLPAKGCHGSIRRAERRPEHVLVLRNPLPVRITVSGGHWGSTEPSAFLSGRRIQHPERPAFRENHLTLGGQL